MAYAMVSIPGANFMQFEVANYMGAIWLVKFITCCQPEVCTAALLFTCALGASELDSDISLESHGAIFYS